MLPKPFPMHAWTPRTRARRLSVLLDFDGTLAPIAATPDQVLLPETTRTLLRQLHRLPSIRLGIVSGRALADVRRQVRVRGLLYVGNHGWELEAPGVTFRHPDGARIRPILRRVARRLARAFQRIPGAWVEWKGFTVGLHWRLVPEPQRARFDEAVARHTAEEAARGLIRLVQGHRVVEIWPAVAWNKGTIIEWLVESVPAWRESAPAALVYLGDDLTDEDAFRAVNALGGSSVLVGEPCADTAARFWLRDPSAVAEWLDALRRSLSPD